MKVQIESSAMSIYEYCELGTFYVMLILALAKFLLMWETYFVIRISHTHYIKRRVMLAKQGIVIHCQSASKLRNT